MEIRFQEAPQLRGRRGFERLDQLQAVSQCGHSHALLTAKAARTRCDSGEETMAGRTLTAAADVCSCVWEQW